MHERGYFDEIAPRWDDMRRTYFSEVVRDWALSEVRLQRRKLAADVGAGTGFITQGLIGHGVEVLAIDESLLCCRYQAQGVQRRGSTLLHRERRMSPRSRRRLDYVFANMCLHDVVHPAAAIGEMARILKKGGPLIITDPR